MTTASAPRLAAGAGLSHVLAVAGLALAIVALLVLAAGPIGWRAGLWHYRIGLLTLMPAAGFLGVAALALSAAGLLAGLRARGRRDLAIALLGMLIGAGVTYFPWHWSNQRGAFPQVNDVTTDFADPPSLAFSEALRKAEEGNPTAYEAYRFARVQQRAYPDIVPARLAVSPTAAFGKALALVKAGGWTIVTADRSADVIDAYDRSFWFGFTDDIAIRVTPDGEGSRVDMRSSARQGRGDFGVNARRVRTFLVALKSR
ncbi:MAG TPA: DUF1499 domain-containing protein [Stellaceae bacterium]|jgi:uncharacterized protein (DUF1499 family)|nr:DUF1499 domain-containing protein [Stellaceae bacterium]